MVRRIYSLASRPRHSFESSGWRSFGWNRKVLRPTTSHTSFIFRYICQDYYSSILQRWLTDISAHLSLLSTRSASSTYTESIHVGLRNSRRYEVSQFAAFLTLSHSMQKIDSRRSLHEQQGGPNQSNYISGLVTLPKVKQVSMYIPGKYTWRHLNHSIEVNPSPTGFVSINAFEDEIVTLIKPGSIIPIHEVVLLDAFSSSD